MIYQPAQLRYMTTNKVKGMKFCKNCGEPIEETATICPKCNKSVIEQQDNITVVYNESPKVKAISETKKEYKFKNKFTAMVKPVLPTILKYQKIFAVVFAVIALIFAIVSISSITSEDYKDASENYSEYTEKYEENLSTSNSYGGYGILGGGYKSVANRWKDLADDELAELWGMRIKAIIFAGVTIITGIASYKIYKLKETNP